MGKVLGFQSCAKGGEFLDIGVQTNKRYTFVETPANIVKYINDFYAEDVNLSGKVTGIGYGWQQYTVESSGKVKFSVRGAAGGTSAYTGATIDPVTGNVTGNCNRPGRGAKVEGIVNLKKDSILYILVGFRGWCSYDGYDWGPSGGGASVVLLDNPNGAYTFAPLNRKVDVLFVAGGGGAGCDSSFGPIYYGRDAIYNNGTNTNGGAGSRCSGGAGLTGNGDSASAKSPAYNLLSGNPSTTSEVPFDCSPWGGGGAGFNGGGGGAGYSGGAGINDTYGEGGTSYINPNLCEETFRGYATVAEDSGRNLTNPWTAYGYVEIELGRDEHKLILVQDSDGYKYFNGQDNVDGTTNTTYTNEWELLPTQTEPDQNTYDTYGNKVITNTTGLQNKVKFLISSAIPNEKILISGNVNGAIIQQTKDFNTSDVSVIKSFTTEGNLDGTITKFAVSKDSGNTWQTYSGGNWIDIDITNKNDFQTNAYDLSQLSTIPVTDWKLYMSKKLRFAFCITQYNSNNGVLLKCVKYIADLTASWRHSTEDQAMYEYVSDTELKVTFLKEGNYKVNYLDELTSSNS